MAAVAGHRFGRSDRVFYSYRVEAVTRIANAATVLVVKNQAWRRLFWVSLPPGLLLSSAVCLSPLPAVAFCARKEDAHMERCLLRDPGAG